MFEWWQNLQASQMTAFCQICWQSSCQASAWQVSAKHSKVGAELSAPLMQNMIALTNIEMECLYQTALQLCNKLTWQ